MIVASIRPELPPSAREPCDQPQALPDRRLSAAETTMFWARDRSALRGCEAKRAAAIAALGGS